MFEMITDMSAWHWLVLALILAALELLLPINLLIWFAVGAGATAALMFGMPDLGVPLQLVAFGVLSLAGVLLGRRYFSKQTSEEPLLNQRSASLVGKRVLVHTAIAKGSGRVKIGDSVWTAEGPDAEQGSLVEIVKAGSAVVQVKPV